MTAPASEATTPHVGLGTIAREWTRIGVLGFGGPPAHVRMLRDLCVDRRRWIDAHAFEDGVATTNLLPGPASTQMAILCAWTVRGVAGAIVGGLGFILPGLVAILALAVLFLEGSPPTWVQGAAAGAGAAVAPVAVHAGLGLVPTSHERMSGTRGRRLRWSAYVLAGAVAAATLGVGLVLVLLVCGVVEIAVRARPRDVRRAPDGNDGSRRGVGLVAAAAFTGLSAGTFAALAWVGLKVGALSYGGGFVIIPLMQQDAVDTYGWLTDGQFLNAVALGQLTPGPVTHTVAVVGYGAAGFSGALVASIAAFAPSFVIVLAGARHFDAIRTNARVQAFFSGAGPAAIGAILGVAIPLARSLDHGWQFAVLAAAAAWLLLRRRPGGDVPGGVIGTLLAAAVLGVLAALVGLPVTP